MQPKHNAVSSLAKFGLCAILALGFVAQSQAQEKKANPTGTWTWTIQGRNGGQERKLTLKLKTEGDKLTGKLIAPSRQSSEPVEIEIKDGKVKGDEISFTIVREFNGNTFTSKYSGKVTDDTIKGKTEMERNGQTRSRDWEAKRETEKK